MSRLFGWSYPPGCSGPPDDEEPCEVCGHFADSCVCPECPLCGECGSMYCYLDSTERTRMELTTAQIKAMEHVLDEEYKDGYYSRLEYEEWRKDQKERND